MYTNPVPPKKLMRKDLKALMWYYSPTKSKLIYQVRANTYDFWLSGRYRKYNSIIFLFNPLGSFPSKMMRCPWILCFDLLPLQYTDLAHQIWRFLVYKFFALPWVKIFWSNWFLVLSHSYEDIHTLNVVKYSSMYHIIQ